VPRPPTVALPALHYWRSQRMLSQLTLAINSGVHARTISLLEHDARADPETVTRLAAALAVEPSALMAQPPDDVQKP